MSIVLHPDIELLDPEGLSYSIYKQLYRSFFDSQDPKSDAFPYGIVEGDETSIRLHNTAYSFASAIGGGVPGEGSGGIEAVLTDYLKLSGGVLSGLLRANVGFEAGVDNVRVIRIVKDAGSYGVDVAGSLFVGGSSLFFDGVQAFSYNALRGVFSFDSPTVDFRGADLVSSGSLLVGADRDHGVFVSSSSLLVKGCPVFHSGNANLSSVDWRMKDGSVAGSLSVAGGVSVGGVLQSLYGFELGVAGVRLLYGDGGKVVAGGAFSIHPTSGIEINGSPVLYSSGSSIQIGGLGGDLLLGNTMVNKISLQANVTDIHGETVLLSRFGSAYFPDSLTVRHDFGEVVFSSYRVDGSDEGVVVYKRLRFGASGGASLSGSVDGVRFGSSFDRMNPESSKREVYSFYADSGFRLSTSLFQPHNRVSGSLFVSTDADFVCFDSPVEVAWSVGIAGSFTRLTDKSLFLSEAGYLDAVTDGVRYSGNAFFTDSLSSVAFSSGFAGYGWGILHNKTTGNYAGTFDELTVRKKMRIYELEVQKISATNGALWISDHCSGDTVIRL